jgi:acyl-CoA hydrolase
MELFTTLRLVKSEDLNHHMTLFAGRGAEWFVESGFIAASSLLDPRYIVCVKIHGMHFQKPVNPGQTACFSSRVVWTGRTSLVSHVRVTVLGHDDTVVDGFISFVHVDDDTRPCPHGLTIVPVTDEENDLFERAAALLGRAPAAPACGREGAAR